MNCTVTYVRELGENYKTNSDMTIYRN